MPGWNFADVWEVVAEQIPDAQAQVHGDRRVTWAEFDRRANGVAATLLDAGASEQDKVAQYLYNCPEYLESMFGTFKAGLVPVNTNYRYATTSSSTCGTTPTPWRSCSTARSPGTIERIRDRVPKVRRGCGSTTATARAPSGPCPTRRPRTATPTGSCAPWGRGGDDLSCSTRAARPACPRA